MINNDADNDVYKHGITFLWYTVICDPIVVNFIKTFILRLPIILLMLCCLLEINLACHPLNNDAYVASYYNEHVFAYPVNVSF